MVFRKSMKEKFVFEGKEYCSADLTETSKLLVEKLNFTNRSIEQLNNQHVFMTRARNAYIEDLKIDIVEKKSGVDLGALFVDD